MFSFAVESNRLYRKSRRRIPSFLLDSGTKQHCWMEKPVFTSERRKAHAEPKVWQMLVYADKIAHDMSSKQFLIMQCVHFNLLLIIEIFLRNWIRKVCSRLMHTPQDQSYRTGPYWIKPAIVVCIADEFIATN
jgi:hypothetical protein